MTTGWKNRKDRFGVDGGNGTDSFEKHNECMREFRRSHADVAMVNGQRLDESALLESMKPLQVHRTMMETGGAALPSDPTDQSALVPIWKVARYKLSQN